MNDGVSSTLNGEMGDDGGDAKGRRMGRDYRLSSLRHTRPILAGNTATVSGTRDSHAELRFASVVRPRCPLLYTPPHRQTRYLCYLPNSTPDDLSLRSLKPSALYSCKQAIGEIWMSSS